MSTAIELKIEIGVSFPGSQKSTKQRPTSSLERHVKSRLLTENLTRSMRDLSVREDSNTRDRSNGSPTTHSEDSESLTQNLLNLSLGGARQSNSSSSLRETVQPNIPNVTDSSSSSSDDSDSDEEEAATMQAVPREQHVFRKAPIGSVPTNGGKFMRPATLSNQYATNKPFNHFASDDWPRKVEEVKNSYQPIQGLARLFQQEVETPPPQESLQLSPASDTNDSVSAINGDYPSQSSTLAAEADKKPRKTPANKRRGRPPKSKTQNAADNKNRPLRPKLATLVPFINQVELNRAREIVKKLTIDEINHVDEQGNTLFHHYSRENSLSKLYVLNKFKILNQSLVFATNGGINSTNNAGETPLLIFVQKQNEKAVEFCCSNCYANAGILLPALCAAAIRDSDHIFYNVLNALCSIVNAEGKRVLIKNRTQLNTPVGSFGEDDFHNMTVAELLCLSRTFHPKRIQAVMLRGADPMRPVNSSNGYQCDNLYTLAAKYAAKPYETACAITMDKLNSLGTKFLSSFHREIEKRPDHQSFDVIHGKELLGLDFLESIIN